MTNSLLIYEESGYLFNDATKRLEWFEIDKILISFTYGVVRYIGTWGGGRTDKRLEGERFYSSEECFKKGDSIPKRKISIYDTFRSLYGFSPIDDYVWEYKNGRAVRGKLESFDVVINHKGELRCSKTYYASEEDMREMFLTGWAKDDLKSFCSYVGDTWNDWLLRPVATRIYDLVSYYGAEEIFGNSYRTYTAKEVCLRLRIKYMEEYETAC